MKKMLVIMLMLSAVSYGWSQTCESMVNNGNADYDSILKSIQIEDDITQDSVLMEQLALILKENSNNTDLSSKNPNKIAAGVLNILLGDIGVGHFYTGQTLRGILDIVFCWTGVPGVIGLIEGIIWLCEDDDAWAERVAKWNE